MVFGKALGWKVNLLIVPSARFTNMVINADNTNNFKFVFGLNILYQVKIRNDQPDSEKRMIEEGWTTVLTGKYLRKMLIKSRKIRLKKRLGLMETISLNKENLLYSGNYYCSGRRSQREAN